MTPPAARSSGGSLAVRLAALQIGSIFVFLLVASLLLYRELARDLDHQDFVFASEKVGVLRRILAESSNGIEEVRPEVIEGSAPHALALYWVRLRDASGKQLIATPGAERLIAFHPPFPAAGESIGHGVKWSAPDGSHYVLFSALSAHGESTLHIDLIVKKDDDEELKRHYRETLLIVLFAALAISVPIALFLTRQGLRPLQQIAETARRISAERLHERLQPESWPSELRELATAFDDMLRRLQEAFVRLSQFSADLAHELRTPINNMMGELEVALFARRSVEEYRDTLASTLEECARLYRLVDGLLFLARAEAPDRKIERITLQAKEEVAAVADFFEALTEQKNIRVEIVGSGELFAEPTLIRRALTNLLANAVRHTPEGGEIRIQIDRLPDSSTLISIRDNGDGIPSQHLARLFDRFYRVDPARSSSGEGTGLGLSIVKSIMELHGGSVAVESEEGKGTTVRLLFSSQFTRSAAT